MRVSIEDPTAVSCIGKGEVANSGARKRIERQRISEQGLGSGRGGAWYKGAEKEYL